MYVIKIIVGESFSGVAKENFSLTMTNKNGRISIVHAFVLVQVDQRQFERGRSLVFVGQCMRGTDSTCMHCQSVNITSVSRNVNAQPLCLHSKTKLLTQILTHYLCIIAGSSQLSIIYKIGFCFWARRSTIQLAPISNPSPETRLRRRGRNQLKCVRAELRIILRKV